MRQSRKRRTQSKIDREIHDHAASCVDSEPLLVASVPGSVGRLFNEVWPPSVERHMSSQKSVPTKTEIEKFPALIGLCHGVAAEHSRFQNTGERPG